MTTGVLACIHWAVNQLPTLTSHSLGWFGKPTSRSENPQWSPSILVPGSLHGLHVQSCWTSVIGQKFNARRRLAFWHRNIIIMYRPLDVEVKVSDWLIWYSELRRSRRNWIEQKDQQIHQIWQPWQVNVVYLLHDLLFTLLHYIIILAKNFFTKHSKQLIQMSRFAHIEFIVIQFAFHNLYEHDMWDTCTVGFISITLVAIAACFMWVN